MDNSATPNYAGNSKKKFLLVVLIIIVVFFVAWLIVRCSGPKAEQTESVAPSAPTSTPITEPKKEEPKKIETPLGEFNVEQPEQTMPLSGEKVKEIIKKTEAIQVVIRANDFNPKEFTAEAGKTVNLLFQSIDSIYVFRFEDPALADIRMSTLPEETRGLSFIAPVKTGDYVFYVEKMGFEGTGKRGVMRVR